MFLVPPFGGHCPHLRRLDVHRGNFRCADVSVAELVDYTLGRQISIHQFKQRAAQLLQSYGEKKTGEKHSRLAKLVRGMPKRLRKCKERNYGRCGK